MLTVKVDFYKPNGTFYAHEEMKVDALIHETNAIIEGVKKAPNFIDMDFVYESWDSGSMAKGIVQKKDGKNILDKNDIIAIKKEINDLVIGHNGMSSFDDGWCAAIESAGETLNNYLAGIDAVFEELDISGGCKVYGDTASIAVLKALVEAHAKCQTVENNPESGVSDLGFTVIINGSKAEVFELTGYSRDKLIALAGLPLDYSYRIIFEGCNDRENELYNTLLKEGRLFLNKKRAIINITSSVPEEYNAADCVMGKLNGMKMLFLKGAWGVKALVEKAGFRNDGSLDGYYVIFKRVHDDKYISLDPAKGGIMAEEGIEIIVRGSLPEQCLKAIKHKINPEEYLKVESLNDTYKKISEGADKLVGYKDPNKIPIPTVGRVVHFYPNGTHPNLFMDQNYVPAMVQYESNDIQPYTVGMTVNTGNWDKPVVFRAAVPHESQKVDGQAYWTWIPIKK